MGVGAVKYLLFLLLACGSTPSEELQRLHFVSKPITCGVIPEFTGLKQCKDGNGGIWVCQNLSDVHDSTCAPLSYFEATWTGVEK